MNSQSELSLFENTAHDIVSRAVTNNKALLHKYNFLKKFQAICVKSTLAETLASTKVLCEALKRCSGSNKDLLQIDAFCRGLNTTLLNMGNSSSDKKLLKNADFHRPAKVDLNYNLHRLIRMNHKLLAESKLLDETTFYFEVDDDQFSRASAKEKLCYLDDCLVLLRQISVATNGDDSLAMKLCQHYSGSRLDFFVERVQGHDRVSCIVNHVYACLLQMSSEVMFLGRAERGTHLATLAFSFMAMESSLCLKPNYRWLYLLRNFQFNVKQSPVTVERIFNGPGPLAPLAKNLIRSNKVAEQVAEIIKELAELGGFVFLKRAPGKLNLSQVTSQLAGGGSVSMEEREICQLMLALPAVYCSRKYSRYISDNKKLVASCFHVFSNNGLLGATDARFYRRFMLLINAIVYGCADAVNGLLKALSLLVECHELKTLGGQENSPVRQRQRYLLNKIDPIKQANLDFYGFSFPADAGETARYIDFLKIIVNTLMADLNNRRPGQKIIFQSSIVRVMALLGSSFETGSDSATSMFCSNIYAWIDDAQGHLANDGVVGVARNIMARYVDDPVKRSYYFTKFCQAEMLPTVARNDQDKSTQSLYQQVLPGIKGIYSEEALTLFCQNIDKEFGALETLQTQVLVTPEKSSRDSGGVREKTPEKEKFEDLSEKFFTASKALDLLMYRETMAPRGQGKQLGTVPRQLFSSPGK
jgi:hypothetical protein